MTSSFKALRVSSLLALIFVLSQVFFPAYAATFSVTLQTSAPSYSGDQPIVINGTISPVPGPNTAVIITVKNPAGTVADITEVVPSSADGSFGYTSHPGGNAAWTGGTFTVNATWGGNGAAASQVVTFTYSPAATSTSTSSTSSTTSTSTSTSNSTSSKTSASTTSSSSSSTSTTTTSTVTPAPEFPASALAIIALVGVALVAVFSKRVAPRPAGVIGR